MNELIIIEFEGESRFDSRLLATGLGIQHRNLVETLSKYSNEIQMFGILPFQTELLSGAGQPPKYYLLNENQCNLIGSLSKNTPQVVAFKVMLVASFAKAREKHQPVPLDPFEIMQSSLDKLKAHQREIQSLKSEQTSIAERVHTIEAKAVKANEDYFTLAGYYSYHRRVFDLSTIDSQITGKRLVSESKTRGYEVHSSHSERFGRVNTYHTDILKAVLCF